MDNLIRYMEHLADQTIYGVFVRQEISNRIMRPNTGVLRDFPENCPDFWMYKTAEKNRLSVGNLFCVILAILIDFNVISDGFACSCSVFDLSETSFGLMIFFSFVSGMLLFSDWFVWLERSIDRLFFLFSAIKKGGGSAIDFFETCFASFQPPENRAGFYFVWNCFGL